MQDAMRVREWSILVAFEKDYFLIWKPGSETAWAINIYVANIRFCEFQACIFADPALMLPQNL